MTRNEAISQRLTIYSTGKSCKHGHASERYTSTGNCVQCVKNAAVVSQKSKGIKISKVRSLAMRRMTEQCVQIHADDVPMFKAYVAALTFERELIQQSEFDAMRKEDRHLFPQPDPVEPSGFFPASARLR